MQILLTPEIARFIEEQVRSGRFDSPDAAVNAAVARLQMEEDLLAGELDDEDFGTIEEGLAQLNRGEGRPWEEVRAAIQSKYVTD